MATISLSSQCCSLASRPTCRLPRSRPLGSSHVHRSDGVLPSVSSTACDPEDQKPTVEELLRRLEGFSNTRREWRRRQEEEAAQAQSKESIELRKLKSEETTRLLETSMKQAEEHRMLLRAMTEDLKSRAEYDEVVAKGMKALRQTFDKYEGKTPFEHKIVEAVRFHLAAKHSSVCKDFTVLMHDGPYLEVDALIQLDGMLALVKADHTVDDDIVTELECACREMEHKEGVPVRGFIGGPAFADGAELQALQAGFSIVVLSEEGYSVVQPGDHRSVAPSNQQKDVGNRTSEVLDKQLP